MPGPAWKSTGADATFMAALAAAKNLRQIRTEDQLRRMDKVSMGWYFSLFLDWNYVNVSKFILSTEIFMIQTG